MPSFPLFVVALIPIVCHASPINRQVGISENVFMTTQNGTDGLEQRVCSIDAVTYMDGETIPTSSPCEHCVCRPPGFACTITSCEYRPGCKAFRRSDQCCPEYQCECEKDGKIYQNGEKIMDNNNPCEVCYCQGGEIICAVIDCYWRNDCPPRYIDNRCCPMYDHCPPAAGAQGPIRHRLPSLTSQITWHNATVPPPPSTQPPIVELVTEPTTTSTTTAVPSSTTSEVPAVEEVVNVQDNAVVQDPPVHHHEDVPVVVVDQVPVVEPVVLNNVQISSVVTPTEIPQDEGGHQVDEQPSADASLNDVVNEESPTPEAPSVIAESPVSTTVIDSTTLFIAPALVLTIAPTSTQHILIESIATVQPQLDSQGVERLEIITTESAPSQDESVVSTSAPVDPEVHHDLEEEPQPTEKLPEVTDKPVENQDRQDNLVFESPALDDQQAPVHDAPTTTQAAPLEPVHDGGQVVDESPARIDVTQVPQLDEVATTLPPPRNDEVEISNELVQHDHHTHADVVEQTTSSVVETSEEVVAADAPVAGENQGLVYAETSEATTPALDNGVRNDDPTVVSPASEAHQADEVSVPDVDINIPTVASELVGEVEVHDVPTIAPVSEVEVSATTSPPQVVLQDDEINDAPTIAAADQVAEVEVNDNPTVAYVETNDTPTIASADHVDEVDEVSDTPAPTNIVQVNEAPTVAADHVVVELMNDVPTVSYVGVVEAEAVPTQSSSSMSVVVQDDVEAPVLNDEPDVAQSHDYSTQQPPAREESTERAAVADDEVVAITPAPVEKVEIVADDAKPTEVPVPNEESHANDAAFDIILDDEVTPSQPETLNQVKDQVNLDLSSQQHIGSHNFQNELPNGVRYTDSDTVEIVNLAANPSDDGGASLPVEQTTQSPSVYDGQEGLPQNDEPVYSFHHEGGHEEGHEHMEQTTAAQNDQIYAFHHEGHHHEGAHEHGVETTPQNDDILQSFHHEEGHEGGHEHVEATTVQNDEIYSFHHEEAHDHQGGHEHVEPTTAQNDDILAFHHEEGHEGGGGHEHVEQTTAQNDEIYSFHHEEGHHEGGHEHVEQTTAQNDEILISRHHEEGHEGHEHESTTLLPTLLNDDVPAVTDNVVGGGSNDEVYSDDVVTTERQFRTDIEVDDEVVVTTLGPEAAASDTVVLDDEPVPIAADEQQTTVSPLALNKVQKVAELLGQSSDVEPSSAEGVVGNKFRLDLGSLEIASGEKLSDAAPAADLTTQTPVEGRHDDEAVELADAVQTTSLPVFADSVDSEVVTTELASSSGRADIEVTTEQPTNLRADDADIITTQPPAYLRADMEFTTEQANDLRAEEVEITTEPPSRLRADLGSMEVEASTVKVVYDTSSGEQSEQVSNFHDEVVATTPSGRSDLTLLDAVEGSGTNALHDHEEEVLLDAAEGSGSSSSIVLEDEPVPTTQVSSLLHDDANDEANEVIPSESVTSSNLLRMDLGSLEEIENNDAPPASTPIPSAHQADEASPTGSGPNNLRDDATGSPVVAFEEVAVQETKPTQLPERFRLDLDLGTTVVSVEGRDDDAPEVSTVVSSADHIAQDDFIEVTTVGSSGFAAEFRDDFTPAVEEHTVQVDTTVPTTNDEPLPVRGDHNSEQEEVQPEARLDLTTVRFQDDSPPVQANDAETVSFDETAATVPSGRSDLDLQDEVNSTPIVSDEPEVTTVGGAEERRRTEPVPVEQQTEVVVHDDVDEVKDEVVVTTTVTSVEEKANQSVPLEGKRRKENVHRLPETGVPKIQPISPDLSRNNPHELRFDFQIPPEKDSTWLSRAVNQFRRLSGFGRNSDKPVGSIRPRAPSRRFLLF